MNILLVGFIISTDIARSIIIFHVDGKPQACRIGQTISELGRIEYIKNHTLYLSNNGKIFSMRPGDDVGGYYDDPIEDPYESQSSMELDPLDLPEEVVDEKLTDFTF